MPQELIRLADHGQVLINHRPVPRTRRQSHRKRPHPIPPTRDRHLNNYQPQAPHPRKYVARHQLCRPSATSHNSQANPRKYQWGATGPEAYDCSGLVYAAYATAGIHIGRTTYQWRQDGPRIPLTQIQPGDLLFSAGSEGTPSNPGHVVMYLGGGQIIQAPKSGEDVQIDPLDLAGVVVATRPADLPHT